MSRKVQKVHRDMSKTQFVKNGELKIILILTVKSFSII